MPAQSHCFAQRHAAAKARGVLSWADSRCGGSAGARFPTMEALAAEATITTKTIKG